MTNLVEDFIMTGGIGFLSVGAKINLSQGEWIESVATHPNGVPELYQCRIGGLLVNIVVNDKNVIDYLVVHMKDQIGVSNLIINNELFPIETSLDKLLLFFNSMGIKWMFKKVFERILIILIEQSNVEMIFSYYSDEKVGLQTIHSAYSSVTP